MCVTKYNLCTSTVSLLSSKPTAAPIYRFSHNLETFFLALSNYINNYLYSTCKPISLIVMSVKMIEVKTDQLHFTPIFSRTSDREEETSGRTPQKS